MKHLALLCLVLGAGACDPGYADDYADDWSDAPPLANGELSATWSVVNDGVVTACPTGATTAEVTSLRAGDSQPFIDLWDCAAGSAVVSDLPEGSYTFTISLTDDAGVALYAESKAVHLQIRADQTTDADFVIDGFNGFWELSWTLADSAGAPTTCAATVQNGISVLSTNASTTEATDSIWNCEDGEAPAVLTTDGVAIGDYVVQLSVLDSTDAAIGQSAEMSTAIDHGNQFVDLGTVPITMF